MPSASAVEPASAAAPPAKAVVVASSPVVVTETSAPAPTLAPLLSELPDATRRQIPTLAISGAVYSENPSQRLLLVNGLVVNQGGQAAPDVTVVEIRSNNSEFSFRGTRFRLAH
jgi:general secretion pathway protein B